MVEGLARLKVVRRIVRSSSGSIWLVIVVQSVEGRPRTELGFDWLGRPRAGSADPNP